MNTKKTEIRIPVSYTKKQLKEVFENLAEMQGYQEYNDAYVEKEEEVASKAELTVRIKELELDNSVELFEDSIKK